MLGLGAQELIIILVIMMLLFGASRLPEIGKGLGTGMREFKDNLTGRSQDDDGQAERRELRG